MAREYVIVNGDFKCVADTDRAILVKDTTTKKKTWIPKAHVGNDSQVQGVGDIGALEITEEIAEDRNIDYFKKQKQISGKKNSWHEFSLKDCRCTGENDKELQVFIGDLGGEVCIKKSAVLQSSRIKRCGDCGTLTLEYSYAKRTGLI